MSLAVTVKVNSKVPLTTKKTKVWRFMVAVLQLRPIVSQDTALHTIPTVGRVPMIGQSLTKISLHLDIAETLVKVVIGLPYQVRNVRQIVILRLCQVATRAWKTENCARLTSLFQTAKTTKQTIAVILTYFASNAFNFLTFNVQETCRCDEQNV